MIAHLSREDDERWVRLLPFDSETFADMMGSGFQCCWLSCLLTSSPLILVSRWIRCVDFLFLWRIGDGDLAEDFGLGAGMV